MDKAFKDSQKTKIEVVAIIKGLQKRGYSNKKTLKSLCYNEAYSNISQATITRIYNEDWYKNVQPAIDGILNEHIKRSSSIKKAISNDDIIEHLQDSKNLSALVKDEKGRARLIEALQPEITNENLEFLIKDNKTVAFNFIKSHLTEKDISGLAYRKRGITEFELLLDPIHMKERKQELDKGEENIWQAFFEENQWIFGYGLDYKFMVGVKGKLEQTVVGATQSQKGKRPDAYMKVLAEINQTAFVEIKTYSEQLLGESKRVAVHPISDNVIQGIAQVQKTARDFMKEKAGSFRELEKDDKGNDLDTYLYFSQPKTFLIIGNLNSIKENEDKITCFELFRRELNNPVILTYDELYERAKYIVELPERKSK